MTCPFGFHFLEVYLVDFGGEFFLSCFRVSVDEVLSIFSVLVLMRLVFVVCCMAVFMVPCLRVIHFPYFSRTCSGVQPVFGKIINRVPVLNSRRGCFTFRYSAVYSWVLGIGFHAVDYFLVEFFHFGECEVVLADVFS